ncbi:NPC intracellular cholesterol transporter 1 [Aplysia californica]|uniref:NPC intracellular cholesterol transporter 1 n=1 Tax=Aplysia californica TaxID=6500 RepID=A0ABM0JMZ3_APLCA|nr:NPC intracellular cholesterol transporter 1 [Aplysia californica]
MGVSSQLGSLIFFIGLFNYGLASCVWYGQCGNNPELKSKDKKVNCLYYGEPKPFATEEGRQKFKINCPDFYHGPETKTCCADSQIITLDKQVAVPRQSLLRCPSCLRNFFNLWCHFTCSANQSDFTHVARTANYTFPNGTEAKAVVAVDYEVSTDFANGMFNSCKNVQSPSSNQRALSLLCGRDVDQCTPEVWLKYMGNTDNTQSPFSINFIVSNSNTSFPGTNGTSVTIEPMNVTTVPCNKAPTEDSEACSCPDCPTSCSPIPPPSPPVKPCEILHVSCYDFAFTLVFAGFLMIFGCYSICYNIMVQDSLRLEQPGDDATSSCCGRIGGAAVHRNARKKEFLDNVSSDQLGRCERMGASIESFLERLFRNWGKICTRHPIKVIVITLIVSAVLCAGISLFQVTTNPVKLWSGPNSRARLEKEYFDSNFKPFYRTEQLIISRPNNKTTFQYGPGPFPPFINYTSLFDKTFMHKMLDLQLAVENLEVLYDNKNITLKDICFAPLRPDNSNCTIQSVFNYFQNRHDLLDRNVTSSTGWDTYTYLDHIKFCAISPVSINDTDSIGIPCMGTFGGPVFPWVAFGGYKDGQYNTAEALVITFVVNNYLDEDQNSMAEAWETEYIAFMKDYVKKHPDVTISFSSERSIEDEIDRESSSDVMTILVSYLIMFGYITVMLGRYNTVTRILVDSKVVLGLSGVFIVLVSVGASLGFYSYLGIPSTLIIVEVVPFLVLAVGVDNIFILVQTYQREQRLDGETTDQLVARVVGKVGPSMLLTSSSESLAFFLGALTDMPAVKVFSLYAAMAVLFDFLLQITCFISLLYLDAKREEANRLDFCCCARVDAESPKNGSGILYTIVSKYYAHFLMKEWVRPIVMVIFVGWSCASGALTSRVNIGLDQSLSMPKDSYVLDYFHNISTYLSVGAPVYFVVRDGHDYTTYDGQNAVCGVAGCPQTSVVQQINSASLLPNDSYIAQPVSSWLDDYFSWLVVSPCCRTYEDTGDFCPSSEQNKTCLACNVTDKYKGRPISHDFDKFLPWFLKDNPNIHCAKGGHAAYGSAVQLSNDSHHETHVGATYFMTYHSVLKTSSDYITALKEARKISDNITLSMNGTGKVFPYSVFYVFYEQYLTIVEDSVLNILYCLAAIFVISFLLLGLDLHSAVLVVLTILMILVDLMGMMYLWDIDLNALSLVNLIMAIGISVEFCSHIIRAFTVSVLPTRKERAKDALGHMGSSVLSGITLTKLGGIIVLGFSKSQLFQVFYFRMYLGMVIFGATHGLIFLPVLLSYLGPSVNKAKVYQQKYVQESMEEQGAGDQGESRTNRRSAQRYAYDNPPAYNSMGGGTAQPM